MAAGLKTGGRQKGTPNKTTAEAQCAVQPTTTRPRPVREPLKVENWPIDRLVEYERNPRKNDDQVGKMADAIKKFGFRIPIVARSDGTLVDGHLRLKAARKLRLTEVPVALADDLSEKELREFRLLANRSATWASWDVPSLVLEFEEWRFQGIDPSSSGFDAGELSSLFPKATLPEPETKPRPVIKKIIACPNCQHEFAA